MSPPSAPTYRAADGVRTRTFDGELVLLDLAGDAQYALNELGARVWAQATSGVDPAAITSAIVAEYAVEAAIAQADVARILAELLALGLLVQVAAPDAGAVT